MTIPRHWIPAARSRLVLSGLPGPGAAQSFAPSREIELVVHSAPGGGSDVFARTLIEIMGREKLLTQPLRIVNHVKGAGIEAMEHLVAKKGDDHTIAIFTNTWVATPLTAKTAKVSVTDLTPVVRLVLEPTIAVVRGDAPYKTMRELADAAAKEPGKIRQAGGSVTAIESLTGLLLQQATKTTWTFIPTPAVKDRIAALIAGTADVIIPQPQDVNEHIAAGRLRPIAALTERRLAVLPNVPTIKEQGIDVPIIANARGILAPPGVAPAVVAYWEGLFERLVRTDGWKRYLKENQVEDVFLKGREMTPFFDRADRLDAHGAEGRRRRGGAVAQCPTAAAIRPNDQGSQHVLPPPAAGARHDPADRRPGVHALAPDRARRARTGQQRHRGLRQAAGLAPDAEKLLTQPVTVVNRTSGSGIEAMEYLVANKGADHTLALFTPSWIAAPLTEKDAKAQITDVTPIVRLDLEPTIVVVRAESPWRTIRDLAAAGKEPGKIRQAGGPETALEALNGQLLAVRHRHEWTYVRMTSAKARLAELLAGKVDVLVPSPQDMKDDIAAGRLRALATLAERRIAALPDVPTIKEQGFDVPILANMRGIVAPPGLAPDAATYWADLFERLSRTPSWKKYLADNQIEDAFLRGPALTPFFTGQIGLVRNVLAAAGIQLVR